MNSILAVEYFSNRSLVRVTSQFDIKATIMAENSAYNKLAYSSLLLQLWIVERLDISRELATTHDLVYSEIPIR